MKRFACVAVVAVMGWVLAGGSTGFGAPPKKTPPPKHGGGKPAHPPSKPKPLPHKGSDNLKDNGKDKEKNNGKEKGKGKPKEGVHEEHQSNKPAEPKNLTVNKPTVGSPNDGTPGVTPAGDAGPSGGGVPNVGSTSLSGLPLIQFRVNPLERDRYDAAAKAARMELPDWIRNRLNAAADRDLK